MSSVKKVISVNDTNFRVVGDFEFVEGIIIPEQDYNIYLTQDEIDFVTEVAEDDDFDMSEFLNPTLVKEIESKFFVTFK